MEALLEESLNEQLSQEVSHFRALEPLKSDRMLFYDSYNEEVSKVDSEENETEKLISDVKETVCKPKFAFDTYGFKAKQ